MNRYCTHNNLTFLSEPYPQAEGRFSSLLTKMFFQDTGVTIIRSYFPWPKIN